MSAETKVYPFFGEKEKEKLKAEGYVIIRTETTPVVKGHGGDTIVTCEKK